MTELPVLTDERRASYTRPRHDLGAMLPRSVSHVLDVGCSDGAIGAALKRRRDIEVWGVEPDPALAEVARERLDRVFELDAASAFADPDIAAYSPSAIIMADVLEHTIDPWGLYDGAVALLPPGGHVLVSLPNVTHWDTHWNMLRGRWPHRDRGVHDLGHLRFFGRHDVEQLVARNGVELLELVRKYRLRESSGHLLRLAGVVGRVWPNGFTFQFMALGRKP